MTRLGIAVSVVYICVIILLRWSSLSDLRTMPLNEFGDFFAGVFGPLTLFWLILGYMQQQNELRQNTKALELQAEELKKSVEQHKELVKVSREQIEADLRIFNAEKKREREKSIPKIRIVDEIKCMRHKVSKRYTLQVMNRGGDAFEVSFCEKEGDFEIRSQDKYIGKDSICNISWDILNERDTPSNFVLVIEYQNAFEKRYKKEFFLEKNHQNDYKLVSEKEVKI